MWKKKCFHRTQALQSQNHLHSRRKKRLPLLWALGRWRIIQIMNRLVAVCCIFQYEARAVEIDRNQVGCSSLEKINNLWTVFVFVFSSLNKLSKMICKRSDSRPSNLTLLSLSWEKNQSTSCLNCARNFIINNILNHRIGNKQHSPGGFVASEVSNCSINFFLRASLKEYPMDSEAPTNLEHKLWLTEKPAPINCIVFSGTLVKRSVQGFK